MLCRTMHSLWHGTQNMPWMSCWQNKYPTLWNLKALIPNLSTPNMKWYSRLTPTTDLRKYFQRHYSDVIMGTISSQITSPTIVYSTVYSDADQRKHQSFASLAFVREIHRGPVNSPHKGPVTRKMFPFDDVIMYWGIAHWKCRVF